jgi:hypothetical protein
MGHKLLNEVPTCVYTLSDSTNLQRRNSINSRQPSQCSAKRHCPLHKPGQHDSAAQLPGK